MKNASGLFFLRTLCEVKFFKVCGVGNRLSSISSYRPLILRILPDFTAPCSSTALFIAVISGSYCWAWLPSRWYGWVTGSKAGLVIQHDPDWLPPFNREPPGSDLHNQQNYCVNSIPEVLRGAPAPVRFPKDVVHRLSWKMNNKVQSSPSTKYFFQLVAFLQHFVCGRLPVTNDK